MSVGAEQLAAVVTETLEPMLLLCLGNRDGTYHVDYQALAECS